MEMFDRPADRAGSDSIKWAKVSGDVIPMWVADMDLPTPQPIIEAMQQRLAHPYFGYPNGFSHLTELVCRHYETTWGAKVDPRWVVWCQSVIPGVVVALKMMGGSFLYSIPMYDHIRRLYQETGQKVIEVPLKRGQRYEMDPEALEAALEADTRSLILCNPHNPVGRVYTRQELTQIVALCRAHELLLICDEIHCELDLEDRHIPLFSLSEEAADCSITLSSAGKICNLPGLPMGFAIIPNAKLRERFCRQQEGFGPGGNVLSMAAYAKAYDGSCAQWKQALRAHLRKNRDLAVERINAMPGLQTYPCEGTYLLWVDCSALPVEDPAAFFETKARVKVCSGEIYGDATHIRFNYACPEAQLREALDRMEQAVIEIEPAP